MLKIVNEEKVVEELLESFKEDDFEGYTESFEEVFMSVVDFGEEVDMNEKWEEVEKLNEVVFNVVCKKLYGFEWDFVNSKKKE